MSTTNTMNTCMDCNQPIDWKTGLICAQCKVPFCVSNCLVNHSGHRLQNIPQTSGSSGDDIFSKIIEADNTFKELKFTSNSMADFLRNFDNEITNHQLKIFSLKERISNMPKNQFSKQQVDVFADRHNSVLKNITHMHSQMFQQMKDAYRFWGTIAAYNYDELVGQRSTTPIQMKSTTPIRKQEYYEENKSMKPTYEDNRENRLSQSMDMGNKYQSGDGRGGKNIAKQYANKGNDIFGSSQNNNVNYFQTSNQAAYSSNPIPQKTPMRSVGNSVVNNNIYSGTNNYALPQQGIQPLNRINADNYNQAFNNYNPNAQFEGKVVRSAEELVQIFRDKVLKRGGNTIFQIGKHFSLFDKNKTQTLDQDEFKKVIKEYCPVFSPTEIETLFNSFDYDGVGTINYNEFLRIIRGPMNDKRKNAVLQLFDRLDTKGDGYIDIHDIKLMYNADGHPDANNGKKPDQVYYEFIESINMYAQNMKGGSNKDKISRDEWLEYYNNISASIDKDNYFLAMIQNCWNRKK